MRKILFTLSLITIKLLALDVPHTGDILSSLEGHIDMLSPYSVNIGHGDFVWHEVDYALSSAEPLAVERTYDSLQHSTRNYVGQWHTHNECIAFFQPTMKAGNYHIPELCGATIEYKAREGWDGSPKAESFGAICNNSSGILSGQTNLRNNWLYCERQTKINNRKWPVHYRVETGDSTNRIYNSINGKDYNAYFYLDYIVKPNGNKLIYSYDKDWRLTKIESKNRSDQTLCWMAYHYRPDGYDVQLSDGNWVHYQHQNNLLTAVARPQMPRTTYSYNGKMSRIDYPGGGYLINEYYPPAKKSYIQNLVSCQKAPVGPDATPIVVARYEYEPLPHDERRTTIYDAYGTKKIYHLSGTKRVLDIAYHEKDGSLKYTEYMKWGDHKSALETYLVARTIKTPTDGVVLAREWTYDDHGNVLQERVWGNLSGNSNKCLKAELKEEPPPTNFLDAFHREIEKSNNRHKKVKPSAEFCEECHIVNHEYCNNRWNLLRSTTQMNGFKTELGYYPNSNLLHSKFQKDPSGSIMTRQFFDYDENAQIICEETDNGTHPDRTCRDGITHKTVVRKAYHPCGKPSEITTYYYDENFNPVLLNRVVHQYNAYGHLLSEELYDSNNQLRLTTRRNYDDRGCVTEEIDPKGILTKYFYDENNNVTRIEQPDPGIVQNIFYDYSNRPIKKEECYPDGKVLTTQLMYDYLGNCTQTIDPWGATTYCEYDSFKHVTKITAPQIQDRNDNPFIAVMTRTYNALGFEISSNDSGYVTTTDYNALGKPIEVIAPNGTRTSTRYTLDGKVDFQTTPTRETIRYEYDLLGRETAVKTYNPDGSFKSQVTATYNALHLLSKTDEEGRTTSYSYDRAGRLIREQRDGRCTDYGYDLLGRQNRKTIWHDSGYVSFIKECDSFGQVTEERTEDASGKVYRRTNYVYDNRGNRIQTIETISDGVTTTSSTQYNCRNQPISQTDALGHTTTLAYDEIMYRGLLCKQTVETDPLGNKTETITNPRGKIERIVKYASNGTTLKAHDLRYDGLLQLTSQEEHIYVDGVYQRSVKVLLDLGPGGRLEKQTQAAGTPDEMITLFQYDIYGRLDQKIKANGAILYHCYDSKGQLIRLHSPGTTDVYPIDYQFTYSIKGQLLQSHDALHNLTTTRHYSPHGQLIQETLANGRTLQYSHDRAGRRTSCILPDTSQITYSHDPVDLRHIQHRGHTITYAQKNMTGRATQIDTPAGSIHVTYDPLQRISSITTKHFSETDLQYDAAGNLLSLNWTDPLGTVHCQYQYDDLYQLTHEEGIASHNFHCDSLHNRLTADGQTYATNNLNQYTSDSSSTYSYDKCGNLTHKQNSHFKYDALDRLVEMTQENSHKSLYTYDSFHRRISKHVLTHDADYYLNYLYDGLKEIGACDSTGKIVELRILSITSSSELGAATIIKLDDKTYFPLHDHRGSVTALLTPETIAQHYRYSAFGEEQIYGDIHNPWRFSSKRTDEESGLVYFGLRYYDPHIGRWITMDPDGFKDGLGLYAYVHNNPLTHFDLWGLADTQSGFWNWFCSSAQKSWQLQMLPIQLGIQFAQDAAWTLRNAPGACMNLCQDIGYGMNRENDLLSLSETKYRTFSEVGKDAWTTAEAGMLVYGGAKAVSSLGRYAITRWNASYLQHLQRQFLSAEVESLGAGISKINKPITITSTEKEIAKNTLNSKYPYRFTNDEGVNHFYRHGPEIANGLNKKLYTYKDYILHANKVIKEGSFCKDLNGYIKFIGGKGKANYAFVGLKNNGKNISTFHIKSVKELARYVDWIEY